jgi:hypothetical protein
MKMAVFWDVVPCCLVEVYRHIRGELMMEAASTSEMSANFYQTTQRNIPEEVIFKECFGYFGGWMSDLYLPVQLPIHPSVLNQ